MKSLSASRIRFLIGPSLMVFLCSLALAPSLRAQTAVSTLVGTVKDQSGAVVLGANITCTSRTTSERKVTVTTDAGDYRIPQILPGFYDVSAEAQGFKKTTVSNIELLVQQTGRVDIVLQVGEVSDTVEVTGMAPLLQSEEASVGNVIDQKRVVQLPLNGRGFLQLAFLVPGVSQAGGTGGRTAEERGTFNGNSAISVGGNRENANVFLLDGTMNTDRNFNMFAVGPSVDAIQEFKVQVNNYSPEFGGQGGGQVNVVTKSGTNSFHGAGWGYFRDAKFDAKNFFDRPDRPIPPFDRQQFGVAAGGRIIRDKVFWFSNYEGFRQTKAQTVQAQTPTAKVRSGDFSDFRDAAGNLILIYDPLTTRPDPTARTGFTRNPFPNNIIPADRIDPVAVALLKYIDLPNQSTVLPKGTGLFFNNFPRQEEQDQMTHRIDYIRSTSSRIFGRYSVTDENAKIPREFTGQGRLRQPRAQNLTLSESHTFGNSMFNEFRFGYMRFRLFKLQENARKADIVKQLGIKNAEAISGDPDRWGVPNISLVDAGISWGDGEFGGTSNARNNSFHFVDTFSMIRGNHSLKFGGDILRDQLNNRSVNFSTGLLSVNGRYTQLPDRGGVTGSSIAQFLLGYSDNQNIPRGNAQLYMRRTQFAFHINDDYKVTPNLTLNVGLRWEYIQPWVEKYDNFSMSAFFGTYGGPPPLFLKANGYPFAFGGTGKAIQVDPITGEPCTNCAKVSRGIILPQKKNFMPRFGFAYRPGGSNSWVIRGGGGVFFDTQIGNTIVDYARNPPQASAAYGQNPDFYYVLQRINEFLPVPPRNVAGGGWGTTINLPRAHIVNYNLTLQRQLNSSSSLTFQYLGSQSRKLTISVSANWYISNGDACKLYPDECRANNGILPIESRYLFRTGAGDDRTLPVRTCCQQAWPKVNANYNAGAVTYERRFSSGLSILSSYTFSKSIDNGHEIRGGGSTEPINPYRLDLWRALSNFDQKHRFVTSWLWELPFGKGKRFLPSLSRAADLLLGGWALNGIWTASTGNPFSTYDFNIFSAMPNISANPTLPRSQRDPQRWFNTSVFSRIDVNGNYGNMPRNILRGPGLNNWDLGVTKRFPISEHAGVVEFRAEFFNAFNHPIFDPPVSGPTSGSFGRIISARDPRDIQFALRYVW